MRILGVLALMTLLSAAACDGSEEAAPPAERPEMGEAAIPPQQAANPQIMEKVTEIQEIQAELEPINQKALEDQELAAQVAAVQADIESAMRKEDPELIQRMEQFQQEVAAAQAAGDQAQIQALMTRAQGLQREMQALQAKVFQKPEIRERMEAFEAAHRARMIEIDPEAEALLDRMDELMEDLSA